MNKKIVLCGMALFLQSCMPTPVDMANYQQQFEKKTGLHVDKVDANNGFLSKVHQGYPVLVHTNMGNVWGRYAARLTASQLAPEIGRVGRFLTGTYESGVGGITGSPFDRALSQVIGQPISLYVVLKHGINNPPQLDIVSKTSRVGKERPLSKVGSLGNFLWGEDVYGDPTLWQNIQQSPVLVERLSKFRAHYIMLDDYSASFMFASSETDYSGMINEFPSYEDFIIGIMDSLADISNLAKKR